MCDRTHDRPQRSGCPGVMGEDIQYTSNASDLQVKNSSGLASQHFVQLALQPLHLAAQYARQARRWRQRRCCCVKRCQCASGVAVGVQCITKPQPRLQNNMMDTGKVCTRAACEARHCRFERFCA